MSAITLKDGSKLASKTKQYLVTHYYELTRLKNVPEGSIGYVYDLRTIYLYLDGSWQACTEVEA